MQDQIYNVSRIIKNDNRNKYTFFASNFSKFNYRLITSTELLVKSNAEEIPNFIKSFIREHGEVLLIFNIIKGKSKGVLLRSIYKKEFCNWGYGKGMFYGLGDLDPDFKYGDPIILVEGAIDRDTCATFISRNCLGVLTSRLSTNQIEVLSRLTNRVILMLDNDEAGKQGESEIKKKLNEKKIEVNLFLMKSPEIKDLGDLLEFYMYKNPKFNDIIEIYRDNVQILGGKLC